MSWGSTGWGFPTWPTEVQPPTREERIAKREKWKREIVGRRIRYTDSPSLVAYWRYHSPKTWHPDSGMSGVVVDVPPFDHYGASIKVRWDGTNRETWLGSMARYIVIA